MVEEQKTVNDEQDVARYKVLIEKRLQNLKINSLNWEIALKVSGHGTGRLVPLSIDMVADDSLVSDLTHWRENAAGCFLTQFPGSIERTRNWLEKSVLQRKDRILFIVEDCCGNRIGQLGLINFSYQNRTCELDSVLRGRTSCCRRIMQIALIELVNWIFFELDMTAIELRVFADNTKAVKLYEKTGFKVEKQIMLKRDAQPECVQWVPGSETGEAGERSLLHMRLNRESFYILRL